MQQNKEDFLEFLRKYKENRPVSFHMPGHKGTGIFKRFGYGDFLRDIVDADITEIEGADNLFQPEGIIKGVMEDYATLYGAKKSYLLVNGSSSGLCAAILSCVPYGGKAIVARNSHKSIYNALEIGNINAVYIWPKQNENFNIASEIAVEQIENLLNKNPDASAVVIPSPNYYGICSDIGAIASICHDRGKILIVDEAHGAHLSFFEENKDEKWQFEFDRSNLARVRTQQIELPKSAGSLGADIVVTSTHKTLASFTGSAILNIFGENIDLAELEAKIAHFTTTSPSYLLMASLAINAKILKDHANILIDEWRENLEYFYKRAYEIEGLRFLGDTQLFAFENLAEKEQWIDMGFGFGDDELIDYTKINLDMSELGVDGYELEKELMNRNIYPELVAGNIVMCMTGIGNTKQDYEALLKALQEISKEKQKNNYDVAKNGQQIGKNYDKMYISPTRKIDLSGLGKVYVSIIEAEGLAVCYPIVPYPPGVPIICPKEVMNEKIISEIIMLRKQGEKVIGVDEDFMLWCYK